MKIDLSGLNIAVTGASRGIGRSIARCLGSAGAAVALHYHKNENLARDLAEELGGGSKIFQADLSRPAECFRLFGEIEKEFRRIDVWVNNAGVAVRAPVDEEFEGRDWLEAWERTLTVNLAASALFCRAAILHFRKHGGGRIINIASRAAFRGDTPEYLAYAASKGGMVSLTRSIARGFGKEGIKAFIIAPGFVRTDMAQEFIDEYGEGIASDDIALSRLTEADDLAPTVAFLASGLADHATGTTIDINAGSYVH